MNGGCPLIINLLLEQEAKETEEEEKKTHKIRTEKIKQPWLWRKLRENFKSILKTLWNIFVYTNTFQKLTIVDAKILEFSIHSLST